MTGNARTRTGLRRRAMNWAAALGVGLWGLTPALVAAADTETGSGVYEELITLPEAPRQAPPPRETDSGDETVEEIVVTGSRIPRRGFETLQPATVLDAETLELRGGIDLATSLNEQAGFAVPATSPVDIQDGADVGQNYVDYLGLGQQRTLTLVNGQRFPAGVSPTTIGGLSVDLNLIPENLVERVETIAVGGAPIYGSDAVAGTVNIILKKDFEGLELFGSGGASPEFGDAGRSRFGITWGTGIGRGNLTLSAQASRAAGLGKADRPATAAGVFFESPGDPDSPFALELFRDLTVVAEPDAPYPLFYGDLFFLNIFGNGIPLDIQAPDSPLSQFDDSGELRAFIGGGGTGSPIFKEGGDGLKLVPVSALYNDIVRYNANAFFNYELSTATRLNTELWVARTEATEVVDQAAYNSPVFGGLPDDGFGRVGEGPIPVLLDNPYLSDTSRAAISAALDVEHDADGDGNADPTIDTDGDGEPDAVGFWRGGPLTRLMRGNPSHTRRQLLRGVVGLEGDFHRADRDFYWDAYLTWGRTEAANKHLDVVQPRFDQAVQVVADADGQPACADPSGGCVPLNVLGTPSAEAMDYVLQMVTDEIAITQTVASANIGGSVASLPAGVWDFAGGMAFRSEAARFNPNDLAENGFTRGPLVPLKGDFTSTELYLETVLPLLGGALGTPGIERLEFEGALRWVDNSVAGKDTTWTAGLRYQPVPDVELRGNLTESIRAPSITELFTPESTVFVFASDPCDERFIGRGRVPQTRAANCEADGIEQPFRSLIVNASQPATLSGNPDLDSERAESSTVGMVLRPRFAEGLTVSVDWFDIEIANAIESLSATDILNACYDSANFPSESACGRFSRDGQGQINSMHTGFLNLGRVEFKGLQSALAYYIDLGRLGGLDLGLNHMFTKLHRETPGSGNAVRLDGEIGRSKHRVTVSAGWSFGRWTVFNQLRWLDSAVFDNDAAPNTYSVPGVDDWAVVNSSVKYALDRHGLELQLNVDNLFDTDAPLAAMASSNGESAYFAGVMGRYLQFSVRAKF